MIEFTVKRIIDIVDSWDETIQIDFAKSLFRTIEKLSKYDKRNKISSISNIIIKFFIHNISNDDNNLTIEFLKIFDNIITMMLNYKIDIDKEILSIIDSLGAFGQDTLSRRYSVYFSTCILRVKD